ncbi:hypothetical protein TraAM80_01915 [Trypanosoma rangeli]|uniref:Uncharacterized protein n=1 Tax=Trypanosoma rangeli TaxID=5698 RepID=A0A3R7MXX0_TRYRA|nr:uncharacterized protein TraAM80_01915 [Trypanosoma rangeli]RNF09782.1 hypothetical protein TraAM80_01915 [Trypanosoma rangeli]|eukprot:RNF09782.1 hypothetical protein TraAM80_01915 [Trypanosoma rangeli]
MQCLMHTSDLSSPAKNAVGQNTLPLVERHVNSHAESCRVLPQKPSCTTAQGLALSSSASSSSSLNATEQSVGSFSLRQCLDLLVRVQKTQAESVTLLTTLRERLFPTLKHGDEACHPPAVPFDDVDREVVRLRIFEVKHSGLNPRLSESIESILLPFQSCFRQGLEGTAAGGGGGVGSSGVLLESCGRVASLREQFMGLAQLQEEAINALGTQLAQLFALPSAKNNTVYHYPVSTMAEDGAEPCGSREPRPHDAALRFLEQLEDVMTSKQHIVVFLAMALRKIYDPLTPTAASSFEALPASTDGGFDVLQRDDAAGGRVSVSLSPPSTLRPSCSAPREASLQSPTAEGCGRSLERLLHTYHMQECRRSNSHESPDVELSPSPKSCGWEMVPNKSACGEPPQEERQSYILLQPACDGDVSPQSANPRSPSLCTAGMGEVCASPPPPLARCLEEQTKARLQLFLNAHRSLRHTHDTGGGEFVNDDASQSPPALQLSQFVDSEAAMNENRAPSKERGPMEFTSNIAAENARLLRLLEAKDSLIMGMQERLLGSVPLLVERLASGVCSSINGSCRSRCSSTHGDSADERPSSPLQPTHTASTSTCDEEIEGRVEKTPNAGRCDDVNEIQLLKDRLAARMEDNHHLRAALTDMKEERQRWKRAARELKEENQVWRERERAARTRCEQLEENILFLKKRLLTSEGALVLSNTAAASVTHSEVPLLSTSSSHHHGAELNLNSDNRDTRGRLPRNEAGGLASPARSRSRTLPPPLHEVAVPHTSVSLQEKRNEVLAKLGRHAEEGTLPQAGPSFPECEEPMVVVSPLTDERVPPGGGGDGGAAPTTSPAPATSFSSSPGAVRIDRRLSPEYQSPQAEHVGGGGGEGPVRARLSTADVNRILASARGLLKSVALTRNDHRGEMFPVPASASSGSTWSDCDSASSGDDHDERHGSGAAARCTIASAEKQLPPTQRRSISPCSSLSYSSARKRAQQPLRHWKQRETNTVNVVEPRTPASSLPSPSPPLRQSRHKGAKATTTQSPEEKRSTRPRPRTAREALMQELRDQLHLLRTQHAGVLAQAEQLQLKRRQVVAAIQHQSNEMSGSSPKMTGKKRLALTALLKRFDATQERVQQSEARLREYVEIVKRQLRTLEDDLL